MLETKLKPKTKLIWDNFSETEEQTLMRYNWHLVVLGEKDKIIGLLRDISVQKETIISNWGYIDSGQISKNKKLTNHYYIGVYFKTDKPVIDFPERSESVEIIRDKGLCVNNDVELEKYVKRKIVEKRDYKKDSIKI